MGDMSRVLLVEDELLISEMISEFLEEHGFRVHAVGTATEALLYLGSGAEVDILFTDINLPGGMDGVTLAQRARELRPDLAVVYTSGRFGRIEQLKAVTGAAFVPKPYHPEKVCALLEQIARPRFAGFRPCEPARAHAYA
jgi:CheY-like chemotaxis protein